MSTEAIAALESVQRILQGVLDLQDPNVAAPTDALEYHRRGLRYGLQLGIDSAASVIQTLRIIEGGVITTNETKEN